MYGYLLRYLFMLCKINLSEHTLGFRGMWDFIWLKNLGSKNNWYKKKFSICNKILKEISTLVNKENFYNRLYKK